MKYNSDLQNGNSNEEDPLFLDLDLVQIETEVPVPDRLFRKSKGSDLLYRLKLSQKIGLLLWLNKNGELSEGGKERLLYLQRRASEEAILAGLKFSSRLQSEKKLQLDFKPHMIELNRRPQSKRYRKRELRRIGIGYRDKGTLPDFESKARNRSQEDSYISMEYFPSEVIEIINILFPTSIEDDWIDLEEIQKNSQNSETTLALIQLLVRM